MQRHIATAVEMERLGRSLADTSAAGDRLYIQGDLGAGKTTLVRGYLHALGHAAPVTSPTYALVEPYELEAGTVIHADLYRLSNPEEVENIGLRDCFDGLCRCLIEWPERAAGHLDLPDLHVDIRIAPAGRDVSGRACTARGRAWLAALAGRVSAAGPEN